MVLRSIVSYKKDNPDGLVITAEVPISIVIELPRSKGKATKYNIYNTYNSPRLERGNKGFNGKVNELGGFI